MSHMVPSPRIDIKRKCILSFDGLDIQGESKNLSLSGALIKLNDQTPKNIHPGDNCYLIFNSHQDLYVIKYNSKVVRVDSEIIGIQFLGFDIL